MIGGTILALAAAAAVQPPAEGAGAEQRIFTVGGYVRGWDEEGIGWFRITGHPLQLMLPQGSDGDEMWDLIAGDEESPVLLHVRVDASAGRLAPEENRIVIPVCSVRIPGGAAVGDEARNCPSRAPSASRSERLLARAAAMADEHPEEARRLYAEALAASPALPRLGRAVALKALADIEGALSIDLPPGPTRDAMLAERLAHLRGAVALITPSASALVVVAEALADLGGYGEAHALLAEAERRWPEDGDIAISRGALYRQQGDYVQALVQLDRLPAGDGARNGMRYHYHRAWTLILLGRYREALAAFDLGLPLQPEYPSAYQLRSCSLASLGRIEEALADQERALALSNISPLRDSTYMRDLIARGRASATALREAAAAGRRAPLGSPCEEFHGQWSRPRERSPLLDAAAPSGS